MADAGGIWGSAHESVVSLLNKRQVLIVLGSGGVGKTTVSASLALRAALNGQRASVCTIDPAKRLASALKIELNGEEQAIPGLPEGSGEFWASMLDPQAVFQTILEQHAPTQERAQAILSNPISQKLSSQTAGLQEYMACERLLQLRKQAPDRLIVLDTPPARHALDFLTAPQRLLKLLNHDSIRWLVDPKSTGFSFARALAQGAFTKLSKALSQAFGLEILHQLQQFFQAFDGMYQGFAERAEDIRKLLHSDATGLVIVTNAQSQALQEAEWLAEELNTLKLNLDGIVFNKMLTQLQSCPAVLQDHPETPEFVHYWHAVASTEKERTSQSMERLSSERRLSFQIGQMTRSLEQQDRLKGLAEMTAEMRPLSQK